MDAFERSLGIAALFALHLLFVGRRRRSRPLHNSLFWVGFLVVLTLSASAFIRQGR